MPPIRLLIPEDHTIVRQRISTIFSRVANITVVAEATDGCKVYPMFIAAADQIVSKTYMTRVEAENTRLRHYLAQLHV